MDPGRACRSAGAEVRERASGISWRPQGVAEAVPWAQTRGRTLRCRTERAHGRGQKGPQSRSARGTGGCCRLRGGRAWRR